PAAGTIRPTGPSLSLIDTLSPAATACDGTARVSPGPPAAPPTAALPDSSAVPSLWLRRNPITRASIVSFAAFTACVSTDTSTAGDRVKSRLADAEPAGDP